MNKQDRIVLSSEQYRTFLVDYRLIDDGMHAEMFQYAFHDLHLTVTYKESSLVLTGEGYPMFLFLFYNISIVYQFTIHVILL